ncbi:MAG: copper amine oxidase N-terminal domain-containing protein [Defluviitaleaceae bacterium]|nr:copper amine oxidase N-terminal domain-containing protein [Defluviitaleaceae bacterium]
MMTKIKDNPNKIFRGIVFAAVLFGLFFIPLSVYARSWEFSPEDAAPPGDVQFNIPGQMPIILTHPLPEYTREYTREYFPPFYESHEPYESHGYEPSFFRLWESHMHSERPLTRRQEGLDILGTIPDICESFDAAYFLNDYISEDIIASLVGEARRLRARSVFFSHEYHSTERTVSLVIYAEVTTTLPHTLVRSVNFCAQTGRLLSMNETVDMEIAPLAERILTERVRQNPEHYYAALSSPITERAFYYVNGRLVILFDGFRLSTRIGDVQSIELSPQNIRTVVLFPHEYRTDGPYGLKMIPLRTMLADRLGFEVDWDEYERRTIVRRNGLDLIEMHENDNEYIVFGTHRRSLEAAPQTIDDRIHVPITFFDQILPLTTFSFEIDGSITFLSYLPPSEAELES